MPTVTVDENKCSGCQACVGVCPEGVFTFDDASAKSKVSAPEKCVGCRACEGCCPDGAITVND